MSGERRTITGEKTPGATTDPDGSLDLPLLYDALPPGTAVGSYIVEELRFEGGFAYIYKARHSTRGERPAALKVLREDSLTSQENIRRFQQEAQTINRLRHPNIVRLYEIGEVQRGQPYIAMEWLDGPNLERGLAMNGPLPVTTALLVMEQLCSALAAVHALGVVHRDLKAQNVVVLADAEGFPVKLVDFGIAKLLHSSRTELTGDGRVVGTPLTMAPEQILGQPVDARTDIYALGLLLYQMVTGHLPYRSPTLMEVEDMHLSAPIPRASLEGAKVSPAVDDVIVRCLAKNKLDRYATVADVVDALREAVESSA
jgi:eukaryotic-like serine/threonine-protein kinase